MSAVQIVGKEYYLKHILGDGFRFYIPGYQRPYAWTAEETEELLDDLSTAYTANDRPVEQKDPYFLGSIVLIKDEHQEGRGYRRAAAANDVDDSDVGTASSATRRRGGHFRLPAAEGTEVRGDEG